MNGYKKFGIQSTYTMPRKRYGAGKYIAKKYGSKKAYTRRVNVRRNLKSGETTFKLQELAYIYPKADVANCYAIGTTSGNSYVSINAQIQAALVWTNIAANYSLFRLNGILIKVARCFNESLSSLGSALTMSPPLYVNYYPTLTTTNYSGDQIASADSALRVDPYVTGFQSKYISIPKNFSNLNSGIGLGTWNPTVSITSLNGEVAVGGTVNNVANITGTNPSYEMQIVYYISACNDKP
jgi:hypothetical protein